MTGRFGPVDADDLVGETSARLLALGVERRDRLTALRVLGLLADHVDADQRVRREVDDLAAEFDIPAPALRASVAALVLAEVVLVDLDSGTLRLAVAARPAAGGLRLEAFLRNVDRSLLEDLGASERTIGAPIRPAASGLVDLTTVSPSSSAGRDDLLLRPVAMDPVPSMTVVRPAATASREPAGTVVSGAADTPVTEILLGDIPVVAMASGRVVRRRPIRTLSTALVAAAVALVLGAVPDVGRQTTTDAAATASPVDPDEQPQERTQPSRSRRTPRSTTNEPGSVIGRSVRPSRPSTADAGVAMAAPRAIPSSRIVAPTPIEADRPSTSEPDRAVDGGAPTTEPPSRPTPIPGPVEDAPCAPEAPIFEVLRVSLGSLEAGTGDEAQGRLALIEGTATNVADEAIVIEAFDVAVTAAGATEASRTTSPILLGAGQTATWLVEVPIGDGAPEEARASVHRWSLVDGGPVPCSP